MKRGNHSERESKLGQNRRRREEFRRRENFKQERRGNKEGIEKQTETRRQNMTSRMKRGNAEKEEEIVRQGRGGERGRDRMPQRNIGKKNKRKG